MCAFPVSRQHLSPLLPPVCVCCCSCRVVFPLSANCSRLFAPQSHTLSISLAFHQICFLFHPQFHHFWNCLPVSLQSPCWLLCLTFLSSWFWFHFFFFLVYFLCLAFVSSAFEVDNFLSTLPDGSSEHKVGSWTALESVFGMGHRSPEVQLQENLHQPSQTCHEWAGVWVFSYESVPDLCWTWMKCDFAKISSSEHENKGLLLLAWWSE